MWIRGIIALALALAAASPAVAADPQVAALQVTLRARGLYTGAVDGVEGPATAAAVMAFQKRRRLLVDGVVGPRTRAALGRRWRRPLGARTLAEGLLGSDVAALQFLLATRGFPSGRLDGRLGPRTVAALRRFQRFAGLPEDGLAGRATIRALRLPPARSPIPLAWPLAAPLGDPFGPRGDRFHAGIDLPAPKGAPVTATAPGRVVYAGWRGTWGKVVTVAHRGGVRTLSAHLSRIEVTLGQRVGSGQVLGRVGSTGRSTGPHLHFEVRLRGAAVDPLTALS